MKNYLLTAIISFAIVGMSYGQTTYADFETVNPTSWGFGGSSNGASIANPSATGVNTSATVGIVTRGVETWAGNALPIGGTIGFSATDFTFTMDVYSSVTGDVTLKLESGTGVDDVEVKIAYTTANAWETLTFTFADTLKADFYNQLVIFLGFGSTTLDVWYFDNVVGPTATMGDDVDVNLAVDDKLGMATTVALILDGTDFALTQDGNLWSANKTLAPYNMVDGGGAYEAIIVVDGANFDTTTVNVAGGSATADWIFLLLNEAVEDGTAIAVSVGTTPPAIDGTVDAVWGNAKIHTNQQRSWYGAPTGMYTWFKIMWDIDNVYLLISIEDATPYNGSTDPWTNDNVEVFFDMNQSAATPYDGDDWQIRTVRGLDSWTGSANVNDTWGADVSRAQMAMADDAGYIVEMAIPWTSLSASFLPLATKEFNFDMGIADCAKDVATRDYIESWSTNADVAYQNTEFFGTVALSDATTSIKRTISEVANLTIYPNPVNDKLFVTADNVIAELNVYDVTGRNISSSLNIGFNSTTLDVSNLVNGIYIVKVTDIAGNSSSRKIRVN